MVGGAAGTGQARSAHTVIRYQERMEPNEALRIPLNPAEAHLDDSAVLQLLCQRAQLLAQVVPQRLQLAYGAHVVPARLIAGVDLGPSTAASRMQI